VLRLERVRATGTTYGPRALEALWSIGSHFDRCSFAQLCVDYAVFGSGRERSEFVDCIFDGSRLRAPVVGEARFVRCSFRGVELLEWRSAADFVDCVFSGVARDCIFHGWGEDPVTGERTRTAEFCGNDFSAMELIECDFRRGIDLRRQTLPAGEGYVFLEDANTALRSAAEAVRRWVDEESRREALLTIEILLEDVRMHSQPQQLVRVADFEPDSAMQHALDRALREASG
jgi:hypothetical protein